MNSYTIADSKYTDLFCVVPISMKLKRCIIYLQIFVERGSARVPGVCSSFYSLSVPMPLLTYHSDAQVVYTILSHIDFNHFFSCDHRLLPRSHDIDCWYVRWF